MKIYTRIKALREDEDLKQKDIASQLNISTRNYSYYENGQRMIPTEVLIGLSKIHKVSVDYILELTDNPKPY